MRSKSRLWLIALALLPAISAPVWGAARPVGAEFRVNGNTESKQRNPAAAYNAAGTALVVWENDKLGLRGRFYGADGSALGTELALVANQVLPGVPAVGEVKTRKDPAVAFLPSGEFLVAWTEEKAHVRVDIFIETRDILDRDVFVQKFSAAGAPVGTPVRLNATTNGFQAVPRILVRNGADAIVVWQSDDRRPGGAGDGIYGRPVSRTTSRPAGSEFKASPNGTAAAAAIAGDAAGNFLVAWEAADSNTLGVFARLYDRSADPKGGEFRINSSTAGLQRRPAIATDRTGGYLVTWQGQYGGSQKKAHIYGQFLGGAGSFVGPQFQVSEGVGPTQISPSVAQLKGGNFLVIWSDWNDISPLGIYGVEVDKLGHATGSEVRLNDAQVNAWFRTSLAVGAANGQVMVPWEGFTTRRLGISARRLVEE